MTLLAQLRRSQPGLDLARDQTNMTVSSHAHWDLIPGSNFTSAYFCSLSLTVCLNYVHFSRQLLVICAPVLTADCAVLTVHVVMTPGIYSLEDSLKLGTEGQVLLGLGMATLVPAKGTAAVEVGDVDGVRVAVSSQSAVVCCVRLF